MHPLETLLDALETGAEFSKELSAAMRTARRLGTLDESAPASAPSVVERTLQRLTRGGPLALLDVLGNFAGEENIPTIEHEFAGSVDPAIRRLAVATIRRIGGLSAAGALARVAMNDEMPEIRRSALAYLHSLALRMPDDVDELPMPSPGVGERIWGEQRAVARAALGPLALAADILQERANGGDDQAFEHDLARTALSALLEAGERRIFETFWRHDPRAAQALVEDVHQEALRSLNGPLSRRTFDLVCEGRLLSSESPGPEWRDSDGVEPALKSAGLIGRSEFEAALAACQ